MSDHAEEHGDSHYIKIYFILLALLVVSFIGPEAGIQWLTLVTAFGIAVVKAYMVAVHFMHINLTPRYVIYTVVTPSQTAPRNTRSHWQPPPQGHGGLQSCLPRTTTTPTCHPTRTFCRSWRRVLK